MLLPNELVIEIFNFASFETKWNMITVFPWLKNYIPNCELCKNKVQAHFVVQFKMDDTCNDCKNHVNVSEFEYLCKLDCPNLYYDVSCGYSKITNHQVLAEMLCEKDDCYYCGRRIMYGVQVSGYQLIEISKPIIKPSKKVLEFVDKYLIVDEDSKIPVQRLMYAYRIVNNLTNRKISNKQKKQRNIDLGKELNKVLKIKKQHYIGYRLSDYFLDYNLN